MEFKVALRIAADRLGWNPTRIAFEVGVTEATVRHWLKGQKEPRLAQSQALRAKLDGFADLLDGKVAA
jgi:predicted transcriptional regulator